MVLIVLLRDVISSLDNFKRRIDSTSNIHKKILVNSSIEMNKNIDTDPDGDSQERTSMENQNQGEGDSFNQMQTYENRQNRYQFELDLDERERFRDELEELFFIINDNMKDFTMDFDINKNMYLEYPIVKKFSNYLRKKVYSFTIMPVMKDIFALKRKKKEEENRGIIKEESKEYSESDDDSEESYCDNYSEDQDLNKKINHNLTINILSELLSCEYIDIGNYNKNFFYRNSSQNSLFNFYDFINAFLIN
eukprot:CAMPEP_0170539808 /NCGR_PEP_ID=MMETSP0209-20121228/104222_1 /TAXON_ID=665100 ORGANISM="Litonotus pictus, Strain P1" /NCGR_SAMPLE_ID=MMETSP0209 /ASSEMBLY_ACC=CAM_ASM_000301 /LENGTH=249 /DNA_ID=CAMNT_0010841951 /DNA_START=487 /DNA_END=1233 /DNA_ORIENTATION=+